MRSCVKRSLQGLSAPYRAAGRGGESSGPLASPIVIRDARPEDNEALIELDRQCIMGGTIELVFDRSPDFFARSRAYAAYRLCVAEEEGRIVGVGGAAIKRLRVRGTVAPWAYFYDLRVRPSHRRRGIARRIADVLGEAVRAAGVAGAYSLVTEGNAPSETFVAGRGSVPFRRCALTLLPAASGPPQGCERIAASEREAAALLEATCRSYAFAPSWDPESLAGAVDRLRALGWQGMYGKRAGKRLAVCFGLWDYSAVMQMTVRGRAKAERVRPFFLYPLGWRDVDALRDGLAAAGALVGAQGGTLLFPHDAEDPARAVVPGEALRIGMTMFVRGIERDETADGCTFVDPRDL